jgi:hypothetical protein
MKPNQTTPSHFIDEQAEITVQMTFTLLLLRTLPSEFHHCLTQLAVTRRTKQPPTAANIAGAN